MNTEIRYISRAEAAAHPVPALPVEPVVPADAQRGYLISSIDLRSGLEVIEAAPQGTPDEAELEFWRLQKAEPDRG